MRRVSSYGKHKVDISFLVWTSLISQSPLSFQLWLAVSKQVPAPQVLLASQTLARAEIPMKMCSKELNDYLLIQLSDILRQRGFTSQSKNVHFRDSHGGLSNMLRNISWVSFMFNINSFSSSFVLDFSFDFLGKAAWMNSHLDDKKQSDNFKVLFLILKTCTHLKESTRRWCSANGEGKCCVWSHSLLPSICMLLATGRSFRQHILENISFLWAFHQCLVYICIN